MLVLDTDIVTLLEHGHKKVLEQLRQETQEIVTTVITRIEILQGRFASIFKAENETQLQEAQVRLEKSEARLQKVPLLLIDSKAAAKFEELRQIKN